MSFFASVKSFLSNATQSRDFPYEVGDPVPEGAGPLWTLHQGKKKADGSAVSIFRCDLTHRSAAEVAAAHDGLKRMRLTRHPGVIQHLADTETKEALLVATQCVTPLHKNLESGAAMWGLHQIAKALHFLNDTQGLVHGNIAPHAIFLDREGDWKLGGFEVTANTVELEHLMRDRFSLVDKEFVAPELQKSEYRVLQAAHPHAADAYSWAKLATWVLGSQVPMVRGRW